jgi:hypothetical protein
LRRPDAAPRAPAPPARPQQAALQQVQQQQQAQQQQAAQQAAMNTQSHVRNRACALRSSCLPLRRAPFSALRLTRAARRRRRRCCAGPEPGGAARSGARTCTAESALPHRTWCHMHAQIRTTQD